MSLSASQRKDFARIPRPISPEFVLSSNLKNDRPPLDMAIGRAAMKSIKLEKYLKLSLSRGCGGCLVCSSSNGCSSLLWIENSPP